MNYYKQEALKTMNRGAHVWANSLVVGLEEYQRHSAIIWVIDILQQHIKTATYVEKKDWVIWLNELRGISSTQEFRDIDYLKQRGNFIFNAPTARNIYLTLISHLYSAEICFRAGNNEKYIKLLWTILDMINKEFGNGQVSLKKEIINRYPLE